MNVREETADGGRGVEGVGEPRAWTAGLNRGLQPRPSTAGLNPGLPAGAMG